jgi:benzoate/toluate 1,2-dioxygenase alpha subunit
VCGNSRPSAVKNSFLFRDLEAAHSLQLPIFGLRRIPITKRQSRAFSVHTINPSSYVIDRPEVGLFTVDRTIFTDPSIFELEMKNIFESTWVYLAHESQLPRPNDFFATSIGHQPVVVIRDGRGKVHCFLNSCPHRGATVCRTQRGRHAVIVCPYHGWSFASDGKLINIKDYKSGAYPEHFEQEDHGLVPIAKLASYRGFIFGSLNPEVPPLEDHLASARTFIDLLADQSIDGLEVLGGHSTYIHKGNWKLQLENGVDGYHANVVHASYFRILDRRAREEREVVAGVRGVLSRREDGTYDLGNGHTLLWATVGRPQDRPLFERREELLQRVGEVRTEWMINRIRNLLLYPNVFLMDQTSSQIRVIEPLAVDRTRVRIYCIAPVGESASARERRLRQFEDFFNASGMATPDDLTEFEACHEGFQARAIRWQQGYDRGIKRTLRGPDKLAKQLGFTPASSNSRFDDEVLYHGQYRRWLELMNHSNAARNGELRNAS